MPPIANGSLGLSLTHMRLINGGFVSIVSQCTINKTLLIKCVSKSLYGYDFNQLCTLAERLNKCKNDDLSI